MSKNRGFSGSISSVKKKLAFDVYQIEVNQVIVMRRCKDSYLNLTDIFMAGGNSKEHAKELIHTIGSRAKKAKVILSGSCQGTWVPYRLDLEICEEFLLKESLIRILNWDPELKLSGLTTQILRALPLDPDCK